MGGAVRRQALYGAGARRATRAPCNARRRHATRGIVQRVLVTGGARRRTSFRGAVRRFTPYGAASYGAGAALYGAGRRTTRVGVVQRRHRTAK